MLERHVGRLAAAAEFAQGGALVEREPGDLRIDAQAPFLGILRPARARPPMPATGAGAVLDTGAEFGRQIERRNDNRAMLRAAMRRRFRLPDPVGGDEGQVERGDPAHRMTPE